MPKPKTYAHDWEFWERGPDLPMIWISVGIACDDGRTFYAQNIDTPFHQIDRLEDRWLMDNVVRHLDDFNHKLLTPNHEGHPWMDRMTLAHNIFSFMDPVVHGKIENLVTSFGDYDHVLFAQTFGRMIDIPDGFPKWSYDIQQEVRRQKIGHILDVVPMDPDLDGPEHHALADAKWILRAYRHLRGRP